MADFTIEGIEYRSAKLEAFRQFHVSRRLSKQNIVYMTDEDSEYVLKACLGVTQRRSNGVWANLLAGDKMMFSDIRLAEMMKIVGYVLEDHAADFGNARSNSEADPTKS